jgi:hypothetical protein
MVSSKVAVEKDELNDPFGKQQNDEATTSRTFQC